MICKLTFEIETILRREILPSGKSRSFINDTPVQLEKLRFLGSQLVDLHSQHQTSQLADPRFHFDLLDAFSDALELRADYQQTLEAFKQEKNIIMRCLMCNEAPKNLMITIPFFWQN